MSETTPSQAPITTTVNAGSLGSANNGTYTGSQGFFRGFPGPVANGDTSVHFDGSSQFISVPNDPSLLAASFTVEGWFKADGVAANCIASCGAFASPRTGWLIYQTAGTGYELRGYWNNGTGVALNPVGNVTTLTNHPAATVVGNWVHVVATFDGTTAKVFLNGEWSVSYTPIHPYVPGASGSIFTIGERNDAGFRWAGNAGQVAYYTNALSASDIAAHYNMAQTNAAGYTARVLANNPVLFYHLNEAGDPTTVNSGTLGSAVQGAYTSGTTPGQPGPQPATYPGFESTNKAVVVNGTGDSVAVTALNLNTNTVTISGWVKATGSQKVAAGIAVSDAGTTYAGLTIDGLNGGYGLGYVWANDPSTYNWSPSTDAGLPMLNDSEWAFVALVVRPTEADVFIASPTIPFSSVTNTFNHIVQNFEGNTLFGSDASQAIYSFNGGIDEVAIWNRSLGAGELYSQYGAAVGGLAPKIFADLQPATFFAGDTLTLSIDVGGTPNLSYQWYNSTGPIAAATNSVYAKVLAQTTDTDTYHLVVTNLYGSVSSASNLVQVLPTTPPTITNTLPASITLYPGGTLNLAVGAGGGGLHYQWKKSTTSIPSAVSATYQIPSVVATDAGSYTVVVTNYSGSVTSTPVAVTVITPTANSYASAIVTDTPEAWYRLDETIGTTILHDSMGRHDGLYTNSTAGSLPTLGAAGALAGSSDTAASFDGTSVGVGWVPYSANLNSEQFAIEAWVKTTVNQQNMTAISSRSASFKGDGLFQGRVGLWGGEVSQNGADYYAGSATAAANVAPGQWTHIVMTYDTSLKVYINGQWDGVGYVDFQRNADAPFIIGAKGPIPVADMFNGQIDEVAVYAHGLTLAQAQNHYSRGRFASPIPPFFTLVPQSNQIVSNSAAGVTLTGQADGPLPITYQWYLNGAAISGATNNSITVSDTYSNAGSYVLRAINLNGNTNSPAATLAVLPPVPAYVNVTNGLVLHLQFDGNYQDSSGRGNNGTATGFNGGSPSFVSGRIGSGAVHYVTDTTTGLPGNIGSPVVTDSSYVTLGNPADLLLSSNVDFSVSYWVRLPAGFLLGDLPFFCSATNSTSNTGLTFAPGYTNGGYAFSFTGVSLQGPANSINDGNWHHLIHSVSRTGNAITYFDGNQVDSRIATGIGDLNTAGPFNIGQDPTGIYPEQGSADIDDLAVWRRALTTYEAYSVYYAATNSNTSFTVPPTTAVSLKISLVGTNVVLSWNPGPTLGTLQQADNLTGPWTSAGAFTPVFQVPATAAKKFYRLSLSE